MATQGPAPHRFACSPASADMRSYLVLAASVAVVLGWNAGMRALGPARRALFVNLVPVSR